MAIVLERPVNHSRDRDEAHSKVSWKPGGTASEIAASAAGAAAGLSLMGAPLIVSLAGAFLAPLAYEGIKAIRNQSDDR